MLHSKYPDDSFKSENGAIVCTDCGGRPFKPGANNTVNNFETHLRSKSHRSIVINRMEKLGEHKSLFATTMGSGTDINLQKQPPAVFAQKGDHSLAMLRNQYLQALENDVLEKGIRQTLLEGRLHTADKKRQEQIEQLDASLESSEKKVAQTLDQVSVLVTASEERFEAQCRELKEKVVTCDTMSRVQVKEMLERMSGLDSKTTKTIEDITGRLARSDHRNIDQIENMTERVQKFERLSKEQAEQLSDKFKHLNTANKEELRKLSEDFFKKISKLEKVNEKQHGYITDLESQVQLYADELQRYREIHEAFRKATSDQVEAHFEQTAQQAQTVQQESAERFAALELEMTESMKRIEERSVEHLKSMEQQMTEKMKSTETESSKRLRALEKENKAQKEAMERFQAIVPFVIQDGTELRELLQDLETRFVKIAGLQQSTTASPRKVQRGSRKSSGAQ